MRNLGLKSFSLLVAILFAYFVNSEANTSVFSFVVPVEIKNLPANKVILLPSLRQAQVNVRGPSFLISQIAASPPVFKIELPAIVENRFEAPLQRELLRIPAAVDVLSIEPSSLEFVFDNLVTKKVRVEVPLIGALNDGLHLTQIIATPAEIEITGPETELINISSIETYPFDVRDLKASERRVLKIRAPGKYSQSEIKEVEVMVGVTSKIVMRQYERLPVEVRAAGGGAYAVSPDTLDVVEISGPQEIISTLERENIIPFVKVSSTSDVNKSVKVNLELPQSLTLVRIQPEQVRVVQFDAVVVSTPKRGQKAETIIVKGDKNSEKKN